MLVHSIGLINNLKKLTIFAIFIATSCNLLPEQGYEDGSSSVELLKEEVIQLCSEIKRSLNPSSEQNSSENELDKHFRLAFDYETAGDFEQSIFHYRKAAQLSDCDCDRLHAEAGEEAAREARELLTKGGLAARPTQFFWGRLQELTQSLPCVEVR